MAERYKMLPSQIMANANTFDLYVLDAAVSYQNHMTRKHNGQAPQLSTDEMMDLMNRAKSHGK